MLLMAYDQHWNDSSPGSIAGQDWFEDTLDKRMQELDPNRTIVAIGGYGYDWVKGQPTQELTFEEAVLSARDSEADIVFDPQTANPHFSFIEDDGNRHDVWFLDGVTAYNQIQAGGFLPPRRLCDVAARRRGPVGLVGAGPDLRHRRRPGSA